MKRSNKKGFTIVELVIVIAIIAILAAVLIPTFASLIQKANESKDTQLVKNLNTALAADNKEHKTMTKALAAAAEFGYDVGKINASATGNEILWDSENDVFCYLKDGKVEYIPETNLKSGSQPADYKLWKIYTEAPATQTFSIYWNSDADFTAPLTVGFDAGNNSSIKSLNYVRTGENKQEVVISTNGGTLTVNAPADTVYHYGSSEKVEILKVAENTYYENGESKVLIVKDGHVALSKDAVVDMFIVEATAKKITMDDTATIKSANIADNVDGKALVNAPTVNITEVASVDDLNKAVNVTTGNVYVKLTGNIDAGATSISVAPNGGNANITIDGDGHSINSKSHRVIKTCGDNVYYEGTLTIVNASINANYDSSETPYQGVRSISLYNFKGILNFINSNIDASKADEKYDNYGIYIVVKDKNVATINVDGSSIKAYQNIVVYGENKYINVNNSVLNYINYHNSNFNGAAIALMEESLAAINVKDTTFNLSNGDGMAEGYAIGFGTSKGENIYANVCVKNCYIGNAKITENTPSAFGYQDNVKKGTITVD